MGAKKNRLIETVLLSTQTNILVKKQWFFYLRVLRLRRMILTKDAWF